jgi:hypothetical protein
MNLSPEQMRAVESGEPVSIFVGRTEYVLIRKEMYEQVRGVYDDSELSDNELRAIAARTLDDLDSAGPIE